MISFDRFERSLPELLDELATPRLPDYADDLFARTAATRQRPGWTFAERWFPMSAIARRFAAVPRIPWRLGIAVVLLLVTALIGVLVAGSFQTRLPAPFGPAANGVIPYVAGGDIFLGDLQTGRSRLLVGGGSDDFLPQFSPDGTKLAFVRFDDAASPPSITIHVVSADGADARSITPEPIADSAWHWIGWAPDSRRVAVVHTVEGVNQLDLFDAMGEEPVQRVAAAAGLDSLQFRPPAGEEILFRAPADMPGAGGAGFGLYAMDSDGGNARLLVPPATAGDTLDLSMATYSHDGALIFYNRWTPDANSGTPGCCQLYVANADGSGQREFLPNNGTSWDGQAVPAPDGSRIAFWRKASSGAVLHGVSVVAADGTGPIVESGPPLPGTASWVWAPDSSKILMYPNDASDVQAYLLDPAGGDWTRVPWVSGGDIDWQRVAPR